MVWEDQDAFLPVHETLADTVLVGDNGEPSYAVSGALLGDNGATPCAAGVCDFAPNGVIARLIVDTTGFTSGTFPLLLSGGDPGDTHFINSSLFEEQTINLDGATGGQFQLQYTENGNTFTSDIISATATAADVEDALDHNGVDPNNPLYPVAVTGSAGNWTVSFQGRNKFNDIDNLVIVNSTLSGGGGSPTVTELVAGRNFETVVPSIANATVTVASSVTDRNVFYNNSGFDGNGATVDANDLDAAPTVKASIQAGGGVPSFANYTSYTRGINGIMVVIDNIANVDGVDATDFEIRVGGQGFGNDDPANWTADTNTDAGGNLAFVPTVNVLQDVTDARLGLTGEDVIALSWVDGTIVKNWVEVTIPAGGDIGLNNADRFYFANILGDTDGNFIVNLGDVIDVNNNQTGFFDPPPTVDDVFDIDRSGLVNLGDVIDANNNQTGFFDGVSSTIAFRSPPAALAKTSQVTLLAEGESSGSAKEFCVPKSKDDASSGEPESTRDAAWAAAMIEYVRERTRLKATAVEASDDKTSTDDLVLNWIEDWALTQSN